MDCLCTCSLPTRCNIGLGYGLGAMNSAGDSIRDYRQESEIQQSKAELEQAKAREAELEQRIRALEQSTNSN